MNRIQQAVTSAIYQISSLLWHWKEPDTQAKDKTEMYHEEQQHFENRVVCGICLEPRLRMVTGKCQHRFCVQCIYDCNGKRKAGLERCPSCQLDGAYPVSRPVIPEDMIEIQKALGVGACDTCGEEMWFRELGDHQRTCIKSTPPSTSKGSMRLRKTPNSGGRTSHKQQHPRQAKCVHEVKMLLDDLGTGVSTRSRSSSLHVRCLQELGNDGTVKRKRRLTVHAKLQPYHK